MKAFTDDEVMSNMQGKYTDAKTAQKEGKGTPRGHGYAGRIASEWMMWRAEALRRGLVSTPQ